jgi:hypothetical protein
MASHKPILRPVVSYPREAIVDARQLGAALGVSQYTVERMDLPFFLAGKRVRYDAWRPVTDERLAVLDEALALETKGLEWRLWHVAAFLDVARSTVYATPWLMAIAKRAGTRGLRWEPAEVRNRGPIAPPTRSTQKRPAKGK